MLKELMRRLRPVEDRGRECPLRCCPVWQLYAQAAKERDELRKENEALRQKVTVLMAEREIQHTPQNTYEELVKAWSNGQLKVDN